MCRSNSINTFSFGAYQVTEGGWSGVIKLSYIVVDRRVTQSHTNMTGEMDVGFV